MAEWVCAGAAGDVELTLIDRYEVALPSLAEPNPPVFGDYTLPHTRAWSAMIDRLDAYVLVSPEYNHSTSAVLKNALDHLYREWRDKAVAFVDYGVDGGVRAVEHLRGITAELGMAGVGPSVALNLFDDFDEGGHVAAWERQDKMRARILRGRADYRCVAVTAGHGEVSTRVPAPPAQFLEHAMCDLPYPATLVEVSTGDREAPPEGPGVAGPTARDPLPGAGLQPEPRPHVLRPSRAPRQCNRRPRPHQDGHAREVHAVAALILRNSCRSRADRSRPHRRGRHSVGGGALRRSSSTGRGTPRRPSLPDVAAAGRRFCRD